MEADAARGCYVDPGDPTTVAGAARAWLSRRTVRDHTHSRVGSLIHCHIEAVPLGSRRLASVRPSEVQSWAADRAKVLAPTTLRKLVGLLRSVLADAVLDRRVAANPVVKVSLPSVTRDRVVPLTVAQVLALADVVAPRYRAMVTAQAGLGLRIADVDLLRRTVRIEHQAHGVNRQLVQPKTASSRRIIPLPAMVGDALATHLAAFPAGRDVECTCPPSAGCSRVASGLLSHTAGATALDQDYYGHRVFGKAVVKANTAIREVNAKLAAGAARAAELPAGTTSHNLRHHFASVLLAAGESVVAVAECLGHDNATLVLQCYGHLMPHSEGRMRKAIDAAYGLAPIACAPGVPQRSAIKSWPAGTAPSWVYLKGGQLLSRRAARWGRSSAGAGRCRQPICPPRAAPPERSGGCR